MKTLLIILLGYCPTEDSTVCVWEAQIQGNQRGQSFVSLTENLILPIR